MISDLSAPRHTRGYRRYQKVGLLLGPALLAIVLLLPTPTGLEPQAQHLVALALGRMILVLCVGVILPVRSPRPLRWPASSCPSWRRPRRPWTFTLIC